MAWFYLVINTYFDCLVAAMLGVLAAFVAAKFFSLIYFRRIRVHNILHRLLTYGFAISFAVMFVLTLVASRTDPDFSIGQRYRQAIRSIKNWISVKADPLLARGGLEKALTLDTQWVTDPERIYYTIGPKLYSILTNGEDQELIFTAKDGIKQAIFSPDGKKLAIKMKDKLSVLLLKDHSAQTAYEIAEPAPAGQNIHVQIGAIQWSRDSRKICFFVNKVFSASSQTQWFVFDLAALEHRKIVLGSYRDAFLNWASDSKRLYFFRRVTQRNNQYQFKWFEVPLETLASVYKTSIEYSKIDIPDQVLKKYGINIYRENKRLRFESIQPFVRSGQVISPSGRRLWVNSQLQLCYQSAYGVRFRLFGLSTLNDYLMFPPKGWEKQLTIEEMRWLPSDRYVILKHYTHGLLILYPIKRKVGILVNKKVDLFGAYPG